MAKKKIFKREFTKFDITAGIFLIVSFVVAFLLLNDPSSQIKEIAGFQTILLVATLFAIIGAYFFPIKDAKDFLGDASLGTMFGVAITFSVMAIIALIAVFLKYTPQFLGALGGVANLFQTFPISSVVGYNFNQILFVAEIWSLTETVLLIGGVLVLFAFFGWLLQAKKSTKRKIVAAVLAFLLVITGFGAWHFNQIGKASYEYSFVGFGQFVFSVNNLGKPACNPDAGFITSCYSGALPQLLLSAFWVFFAFGFGSWVFAWRAHAISNKIGLISLVGLNPLIIVLFLIDFAIIFIAIAKGLSVKELKTFNFKTVFSMLE